MSTSGFYFSYDIGNRRPKENNEIYEPRGRVEYACGIGRKKNSQGMGYGTLEKFTCD